MPTNKQERERARRNLQQQLERRREAEARRRKTMIAVTSVATVAVIAVVLVLVISLTGGSDKTPAASGSSSASASASTAGETTTSGPCGYTNKPPANANVIDVGVPPDPNPTPTENRTLDLSTNLGTLTIELDAASAPCNVQAISFLAQTGFYNGTSCHRLVTSGIYVLQCGDPSGTGSGGPSFQTKDENLTSANYAEGVVAMANAGANTNSSQFFIMTQDSNAGLQKNYTVIGKVTAGLDLVKQVAAGGTADGSTDGKPKDPLTFEKATVTPALDIPASSGAASSGAATESGAAPSSTESPVATGSPSQ